MQFFNGSLYVHLRLLEGAPLEQWRKMNQTRPGEYTLIPETAAKVIRFKWPGAPTGFVTSCSVHGDEQLVGELPIEVLNHPHATFTMSTINTLQVLSLKVELT